MFYEEVVLDLGTYIFCRADIFYQGVVYTFRWIRYFCCARDILLLCYRNFKTNRFKGKRNYVSVWMYL